MFIFSLYFSIISVYLVYLVILIIQRTPILFQQVTKATLQIFTN